jgi:hypothetical protein
MTSSPNTTRPESPRRESSVKKNEKRILLGPYFVPGENAVICGRGKAATNSPGNQKLKNIIYSFAGIYAAAMTKEQKSFIVTNIISLIQSAKNGAFVKYEEGTWWEVDDTYAKEKVGYLIRDLLHNKYRSSSKAKQDRKRKGSTCSLKKTVLTGKKSAVQADVVPSIVTVSDTDTVCSHENRSYHHQLADVCKEALRIVGSESFNHRDVFTPSSTGIDLSRCSLALEQMHDASQDHEAISDDDTIVTIEGGEFNSIDQDLCLDLSNIFS